MIREIRVMGDMGDKWILGSHDTMSYLRPRTWWGRLFSFVARCQSRTIAEQWQAGVRYFDLRIGYDSDWNAEFRHGAVAYVGDFPDSVMAWLAERARTAGERVWVRVLLEKERESRVPGACVDMFRADCERWQRMYPELLFHCGRRKSDWQVLYDFGREEPSMEQAVSSMTWKKWDDWCPWIYARLMNRKTLKRGTDKEVLLIDFV